MIAFRKAVLLCPSFVLCAATVYALREDYIDETLVFATLERSAVEPGYWFDLGRDGSGHFMRHNVVLEYGITDHWIIDGRATVLDERGDGFHFDSSRLETRYRFYEEGTLPIDIAASGEINSNREENGHQIIGNSSAILRGRDASKIRRQPTEWPGMGNQTDAAMIFAETDFVSSFDYHATFLGCVRMDLYD